MSYENIFIKYILSPFSICGHLRALAWDFTINRHLKFELIYIANIEDSEELFLKSFRKVDFESVHFQKSHICNLQKLEE